MPATGLGTHSGACCFGDEPFVASAEGAVILGHNMYVQRVIGLPGRVRKRTERGVPALIGPWGSGPSRRFRSLLAEFGIV